MKEVVIVICFCQPGVLPLPSALTTLSAIQHIVEMTSLQRCDFLLLGLGLAPGMLSPKDQRAY